MSNRIKHVAVGVLALALLMLTISPAEAQTIPDPGDPDTLKVDSVVAFASGRGIVPVRFVNDQSITSLEVVLTIQSPQIQVDSVSFDGSRLEIEGANNGYQITQSGRVVTIFSTPGSIVVPAGNGLLGVVYYSYPASVPQQVYTIDTTSWSSGLIQHATTFGISGGLFVPQYDEGYLDIQAAPATLDSLWIDSVGTEPGQAVALDIHAFNERDIAEVTVALDYGSERLMFDSVSFTGTRGAPAGNKTVQEQSSANSLFIRLEFGDDNPMPPGTGPLATMHFTIDPTSIAMLVMIDTIVVGLNSVTEFTLTSIDGGASYTPLFNPGYVDIKISTDIDDDVPDDVLPSDFNLAQNYPNPFNPTTSIELSVPTSREVTLDVFNVLGRKVRQLLNERLPAGVHQVEFDGRSEDGETLATGVYFYRVTAGDFVETRKMLLLK
ncbi:T9SS type A sorting domain-containing protein [candidate division GN15 bacterium]|nr:T9SS type A sorting domain-containing protein [candidate division GN15 bacterium]